MCTVAARVAGAAAAERTDRCAAASAALRAGDAAAAHGIYCDIVREEPGNTSVLLNKSLAALKLGNFEAALSDADRALVQLQGLSPPASDMALAKAHHRKGVSLLSLGRWQEGCAAFLAGLAACQADGRTQLRKSLASASGPLTPDVLSKHWAQLIGEAEAPIPLSARDGKLLKPVSPEHRLPPAVLAAALAAGFAAAEWLAAESRELLVAAWAQARHPQRAACALVRGRVYLSQGTIDVAMRDAKVALAYAPQRDRRCAWPAAHALHSAVLEAQVDNTQAALAMQQAQELRPAEQQREALERLLRRIPDAHAQALRAGGAAALEAALAAEAEEAKPEFLKQRPQYYYFNQWMRGRLATACPALPEPVVLKMLDMEAGELDLVLQYPAAAAQQALELLECYETEGAAALEARQPPQLTWEQVKTLKGPGIVGLGMGGLAPGELPAPPKESLVAAGLPAPPRVLALEGGGGRAAGATA